MAKSKLSAKDKERGLEYLTNLHSKYESIGQDFFDYLEGLLHSKGLKYWEYIQIDALHGLQIPKTNFCLLYTSPSPRDRTRSRMPSSA